jgi:hypothetical protein
MKVTNKFDPMPTVTIQLTKTEFQELYSALAHYHDHLAGCTAPTLAQNITRPLMNKFRKIDNWRQ